jgi:regulatory protein
MRTRARTRDDQVTGVSVRITEAVPCRDRFQVDRAECRAMSLSRRKPPSLMARAVRFLSQREHSRVELARKLTRHLGPDDEPEAIERVLDRLQADGLLSDARFAAAHVRQRATRHGDLRLRHDLRERGVAAEEIETALARVEGSELERAFEAWSKRFDALPANASERGKQGRFLQARGFSMNAITRVLAGKARPAE